MKLLRNARLCHGCRTCELICGFRRRGEFAPGSGAITVCKDNRTGEIIWLRGFGCDFCEIEGQPLCVKYCSYGALTVSGEED
ncbi:MAG: hypothetical protein GTO24_06515 [candidate division Zixibacteria bacterium]|nr:hypothetical protein [candidate division Zixibacteria bacterium]